MTPQEFIAKWQDTTLSERSACQQHFLDICELLGQPKPADVDKDGSWYTFERGVDKNDGGKGWADVWMKGHFGWEYKGKHKDLVKAYQQLLKYREALDSPPLLVVCDMDRFEIHTNFTGTPKTVHEFNLSGLAEPQNLDVLRKLFTEPEALKPGETTAEMTQRAAQEFARLSDGMRDRGIEPHRAAHFLMKLMFCMFAEDIELLKGEQPGEKLFTQVLTRSRNEPARLAKSLTDLFEAMCSGGDFWGIDILHFNGGLFKDADVVELTPAEIRILSTVNDFDWSNVEPSIFGTLFERTLDPAKRSQIGAHYTRREDIETLLEPVMMAPLRREWKSIETETELLWPKIQERARQSRHEKVQLGARRARTAKSAVRKRKESSEMKRVDELIHGFLKRLSEVRILDPACGSGNFLYVAIHLLLGLEKDVISYGNRFGITAVPQVRPTQLSGIEINPYAQELAQVVIWIGFLQWMHHNGFQPPRNPVLEPFDSIKRMDAILDLTDPEHPTEPEWPEADFIVGNPPFLGGQKVRDVLGAPYVESLFPLWKSRVPNGADLCCYWFEKARHQIVTGKTKRAGLLGTQAIRGGTNRQVLKRIKDGGDIFFAVADREWVLDGAMVHVSMVGFDDKAETIRVLDGCEIESINADLTGSFDLSSARHLTANQNVAFQGPVKVGAFDIDEETASSMLSSPNAHQTINSTVIRAWVRGESINRRVPPRYIIDFGELESNDAAQFEQPFEHVVEHVKPSRLTSKDNARKKFWWRLGRSGAEFRNATRRMDRYLATCQTAKHRLFVWCPTGSLPAQTVIAFANDADEFFGVISSRIHTHWALRVGTQLREIESGARYTPTTCFETFPFPDPSEAQREAIAQAARELDGLRNNWLNPSEWTREEVLEFPGSVDGPWSRYVTDPDDRGIGTVRYPRLVPKDEAAAKKLKKRTLTNLYNEHPTWLDLAHRKLDEAVFAAYGWNPEITDDDLLANLLALNLERAAAEQSNSK